MRLTSAAKSRSASKSRKAAAQATETEAPESQAKNPVALVSVAPVFTPAESDIAAPGEQFAGEQSTETESPKAAKATAADRRAQYVVDATAAKAIFATLSAAVSVPVKPANGFKAKPLNPKAYSLTERGAAAILCAVAASGKPLSDGETYLRRFNIGAVPYVIENGAFSDFIGTAYSIDSTGGLGNESFTLLPGAVAAIRGKLGAKISAFQI